MKKLAVLLGLSGALLSARADLIRTFEGHDMAAGDCEADTKYGACMLFAYPPDTKLDFVPASGGFGQGQVLKMNYTLDGDWASAGVGAIFTIDWSAVDATKMTAVKVSLRADKARSVEVALKTGDELDPDYQALGTAGVAYMATKDVDELGTTLTIPVASFVFPTWWNQGTGNAAAIAWVGGKTKAMMEAKRADVLKQFVTLQIAVPCREGTSALYSCTADAGTLEIDNVTIVGVTDADGMNLIEGAPEEGTAVLPRKAIQGLRTVINGQSLTVGRTESSNAALELIRLDGSKVANWSISGSVASVALPAGLEKGTYYAVVTSEGKRHSTAVSIVR